MKAGAGMAEFLSENILSVILMAAGAFILIFTYAAAIRSAVTKKHVSGLPAMGGIFLLAGGLISSCKALALLGLLDYGVWMLPAALLRGAAEECRLAKRLFPREIEGLAVLSHTRYRSRGSVKKPEGEHIRVYTVKYYAVAGGADGFVLLNLDRDMNVLKREKAASEDECKRLSGVPPRAWRQLRND